MTRVNVDMDVNLLVSLVQQLFPRDHRAEYDKRTNAIEVLCPRVECGRVWTFKTNQTLNTADVANAARRASELHRTYNVRPRRRPNQTMAFNKIPEVLVKMSVYDYADLLRKYAPPSVCVWYTPLTESSRRAFETQPTRT